MPQLVAQDGKKSNLLLPCHKHAITFLGFGWKKSIRELQRGQVRFSHYLHSHCSAGCFLSAALPRVFNLETTFGFCEFLVEDDKIFGTRVVDSNEWIWGCRMTGSLDSVSSL